LAWFEVRNWIDSPSFIDNFQVDKHNKQICKDLAFGLIELLLGVDVISQNYSLMENDAGSHQIMQ
jgi:hypothetical protein